MIYGIELTEKQTKAFLKEMLKDNFKLDFEDEREEKKPPCKHQFDFRYLQFCPHCGKPVIVKKVKFTETIPLGEYDDDLEKACGLSIQASYFSEDSFYIGIHIKDWTTPEQLIVVRNNLSLTFKDEKIKVGFHTETSEN